jgi:hypothetical protein
MLVIARVGAIRDGMRRVHCYAVLPHVWTCLTS